MKKEIVPILMDNEDDGLYLILNYLIDGESIDNVIFDVPEKSQSKVREIFNKFSKNDLEEEFHYYVVEYVKQKWREGEKFEILSSQEQKDIKFENDKISCSTIGTYLDEAKMGKLHIYVVRKCCYLVNPPENFDKSSTVVTGTFGGVGLSERTIKEIERLINCYDKDFGKDISREDQIREILSKNS